MNDDQGDAGSRGGVSAGSRGLGDWKSPRWRSDVRRRLLAWFDQNARTLPWRSDPTPYKVWVSEMMLQQTQVATVLPYFDRFLAAFGSIEKLASAPEDRLLSLWEGLGYYRRARHLHRAAKEIVEKHRGEFPLRYDEVLALPGIGRYTAGAILSIADDQRLPILEGNTVRVFSRWIALGTPPSETAAQKTLWDVAEKMLPPRGGSGRFNQAAMELGALVCRPKPECDRCPVRPRCAARRLGLQDQIPGKVTRIQYENRTEYAFVVERSPRAQGDTTVGEPLILVRLCGPQRRWAGMWDYPRANLNHHDTLDSAIGELVADSGLHLSPGPRVATIKHGVTKYRIELRVHVAKLVDAPETAEPGDIDGASLAWVTATQMQSLAMPVTARRILKIMTNERQRRLF